MYSYPKLKNSIIDYIILNIVADNEERGISSLGVHNYLLRKGLILGRDVSSNNRSNFYKKYYSLRDEGYIIELDDLGSIRISKKGIDYLRNIEGDIAYIKSLLNMNSFIGDDYSSYYKDIVSSNLPMVFLRTSLEEYNIINSDRCISFKNRGLRKSGEYLLILVVSNSVAGVCTGYYNSADKVISIDKFSSIPHFLDICGIKTVPLLRNKVTRASKEISDSVVEYLLNN